MDISEDTPPLAPLATLDAPTTTTTTSTSISASDASTNAGATKTESIDGTVKPTPTSTSNPAPPPPQTPQPKTYEAGVAPIKPEFLIFRHGTSTPRIRAMPNDDEAEVGTSHVSGVGVALDSTTTERETQQGTVTEKTTHGGPDRRPRTRPSQKADKKAFKGQNTGKARRVSMGKTRDELDLCWRIVSGDGKGCVVGARECRYTHDVGEYLRVKERDLKVRGVDEVVRVRVRVRVGASEGQGGTQEERYVLVKSPHPFFESDEEGGRHVREGNVALLVGEPEQDEPVRETGMAGFECIDPTTTCPTYDTFGECRFGFKCRFLGGHVRVVPLSGSGSTSTSATTSSTIAPASDGVPLELLTNPSLIDHLKLSQTAHEMNRVDQGVLKALRGRKYPLPKTDAYLSSIGLETMGQQQASWEAKQQLKHQKYQKYQKHDRQKGAKGANKLRNRARPMRRRDEDGDVVFEEGEQEEEGEEGEGEGEVGMDVVGDGKEGEEKKEKEKEEEEDVQMSAPTPTPRPTPDASTRSVVAAVESSTATATPTPEEIIAKRTIPQVIPIPPLPHVGGGAKGENDEDGNDEDEKAKDKDKVRVKEKEKDTKISDSYDPDPDPDSDLKTRIRPGEKKRLYWDGLNYLAPLTTVGNLPFRRLCTYLGADITCGEMSLTHPLLSGQPHEWSLLRRHPSEKIFGVQVAGSRPGVVCPVGEVLGNEFGGGVDRYNGRGNSGEGGGGGGVDFVDVNCGCPIDMVFNSGSGSALLDTPTKLARILGGMSYTLGDIPLTIKVRTGVKEGRNTVHRMLPRLVGGWGGEDGKEGEGPTGVGCVSIHGRTRQQRYTKSADWEYIKLCVEKVREREEEEDLSPIPIFGNGDIFSPSSARSLLTSTGVSGLMVGRGALIKPWIFSELSAFGIGGMGGGGMQPRLGEDTVRLLGSTPLTASLAVGLDPGFGTSPSFGVGLGFGTPPSPTFATGDYDISSRERLSLIRLYALYALDHFGSDTPGVQKARRYLCEMLSFMWRYIPVGILERVPVGINERGGVFEGRDELETLLASPDCRDWVRVSEMFLGKAPESWRFVPKHRSNAYGSEESQG